MKFVRSAKVFWLLYKHHLYTVSELYEVNTLTHNRYVVLLCMDFPVFAYHNRVIVGCGAGGQNVPISKPPSFGIIR